MGIQQILSIGALALFTYSILTFTTSSNVQYDTSYFNEAVIVAISIGESVLEEIQKKAFDERSVDAAFNSLDSLTIVSSLGNDAGETTADTFDDIDDYDDYSRTDSTRLGDFEVEVEVYYIEIASPDTKSVTRTFLKRIDVTVSNSYLAFTEGSSETLLFNGIVSY